MVISGKEKSKVRKVRSYFQQGARYLRDNYNVRFRQEIVSSLLTGDNFSSILDVACGSAEISIPFLNEGNRLTLIDSSLDMIDTASGNIPAHLRKRVELRNEDFMESNLPACSYDLIICTGLLAHVDEPARVLGKIVGLLMPGGVVVIQNTDSAHFYSHFIDLYRAVVVMVVPSRYRYNKVSESSIITFFEQRGLKIEKTYRYIQSFLFFDRLLKPETRYRVIRSLFGSPTDNRRKWLGNDAIYVFRQEK